MGNPRRAQITATRRVNEAWERQVERIADAVAPLTGETRIRQALDATLSGYALLALQKALAMGFPGWTKQEDGLFRHNVEGGYVVYSPGDHSLEIVATLSEELCAQGAAKLTQVGIRARQTFHRLLAHAYRDALLSLAQRRGVAPSVITQTETDDYLEIEFMLPD